LRASANNNEWAVWAYLSLGADPNFAIGGICGDEFEHMFEEGANCPPLLQLVCSDSDSSKVGVASRLIEAGATVDFKSKQYTSALWWSCYTGQADMVKLLLEKGANPNTPSQFWFDGPFNRTCLHAAIKHPAIFQLLMKHGADPSLRDSDGLSVLQLAQLHGLHLGHTRKL
jgi:ankyrin repeat protein